MTTILKNVVITSNHKLHLDLDVPAEFPVGATVVTVMLTPTETPDNDKAIECLRKLSQLGGVPSIPNPDEWQREIRQDKELPR